MNIPHMNDILQSSVEAFLLRIEAEYEKGLSSPKEYHAGLGKALAYVEAQFALGTLLEAQARELIERIEHLLKTS